MKELLIIPIIAITLLGIASQLVETAEQSGEKVVSYAEDMNDAMDCAFLGKPLSDCSPDLLETDFKEDIQTTQEEIEDIQKEIESLQRKLDEREKHAN